MSKNSKLMIYLLGGYVLILLFFMVTTMAQGSGIEEFGLAAIVLSAGVSVLLFAIGIILGLVNLIRDDGGTRPLDHTSGGIPLREDRVSSIAFFSSAGLILLIGGSLCLGTLAMA